MLSGFPRLTDVNLSLVGAIRRDLELSIEMWLTHNHPDLTTSKFGSHVNEHISGDEIRLPGADEMGLAVA